MAVRTNSLLLALSTATTLALLLQTPAVVLAQSQFDYSQQPIPIPFLLGDSYPDRPETDVCRPIFDHIRRDSARFTNELVFNTNQRVTFATSDSRRMTSRMQTRLDRLREIYNGGFTVLKAWSEFPDSEVADSQSLHYEGRTIRVYVEDQRRVSEFLTNAVQAAFDWVSYQSNNFVRLSVIPDNCENNVDLVFILDQSGSVGSFNHALAILFILNVIQYFSISPDATRVGFVAYSRRSHVEFDLDDFTTAESLAVRIGNIYYRGGATATALALNDTAFLLNPDSNRGARPTSKGIPKVALLITDGKSNQYPLTYAVPHIKSLGIQVYALGIANPDVDELQFIASDPDIEHVFLLNSYNDAAGFVDFLTIQTCDTPAIIDPGDNTTTEVPEGGIRYFQVQCDSFSNTVLVELYDNTGTSFLYCSATEANPGPLTSNTVVNNTVGVTVRTCLVSLANTNSRVVYIGVQGADETNQFTVVVWDQLFSPAEEEIVVLEGQTGSVYDVSANFNAGANGITFRYLITEGNTGDVFSVNRNGQISVPPQGLAFDVSPFYSLSIVAENVDDSCQRSRFRLNVRVGRNEIIFPNLAAVSVIETASVGDEVTTIIATGGAGQIEYSLLSSNVPFRIEATTGRLFVDGGLNFEDEMQYSIVVEAESVGTIVSGSATQVVNIDDVNEQPEWSTQCARSGICTASITENLPPRAIGSRLEVVDPDLPSVPNGVITYTITPNDARVLFSVGSDGTVRTTGPLDREARDTHTFTVTVADGGTPSLSVTTTFRVTVLDENDVSPTFVQGPTQISIPENEPVDTVIAQYIATDPDTEPNAQITYSLSPSSGLPFELNPDNGALSITQNIDYEDPGSRSFLVTATANNNPLSTSVQTRIDITDVNDNTPVFQADGYTFTIQEHAQAGSAFGTVLATDADSGLNGDVRYSITGGNSQGFFSIVSTTGAITVEADIDREHVSSVELRVRAKDRGSPRLSSTVTVTVKISDINDNPPVFDPDSYAVSLREDKPVDALAFTVFATDADKPGTDNSRIVYSITQGNFGNAFRIDNSGMVFVNTSLNHEAISSYVLTIRANDQGSPQMSDTATAVVSVLNVNEAPPTLNGDQSIDLSESTPTGVIVASFSASDPDFTTVSISIVSGNSEQRFAISDEGDISLVDQLDYEFTSSYTLTIQASDGEQIDTASLSVNVLDENEFIPQFSGPTEFSIDEERASGVLVGTVSATDGDGTAPNNAITYSFSTQVNLQDYLTLDSTSGEIRTATVLDRETLTDLFPVPSSSLTVQIFARDGGSPSLQTSREFTIILRDINDNSPVFGDSEYSSSIFENQPAQMILTFSAVDNDLGTNADVRFSFSVHPLSGASLFQLVDDTVGEISTTGGLDCEVVPEYTFTITARDMGNPVRSSNAIGTLTLRDQNDNAPVFTPISSVSVLETTPVFEVIATVTANDADKGLNGEVIYEILGQDDFEEEGETVGFGLPFFEIDSDSGEITHITPFNFESFPEVTITVRANDRGTPRLTSTAQVVFTVLNVDESAPRFGRNCRDVTLPENTPADTLIVDCMATDIDNTTTPDDPEWITYTIDSINGNTDDTFRIGLHDGAVRNNVDLDFEANDFFRLVLRATDGSGRSRTETVDIVVTDENDNAPQFQMQSIRFAMTSEAIESNTQMIATARTADRDSGSNSEIHYSIAENGIERVSSTETRVVITATDGGATPLTSTATLTVQFDDECLLQRYAIDPSSGEVSAKLLCSVEITPDNTEVVLGEDHIAYCRVARNSPVTYQWILNGSAIDLSASLSDEQQQATLNVRSVGYQDAGAYACKVTTEAGSLQTSTYTINILVVPAITLLREPTAVSESASVEFTCHAVGTPAPSISWEFQGRTVATGNTLTIDKADVSTQGDYSCVAVNVAGSTTRDTRLVVFVTDDVAAIVINNVDLTSPDGTCRYLDPETIEELLSLTGVTTMVTGISADDLCEISNCSPNPCGNGGACQLDESVEGGYSCACPEGFTGVDCMTDVDECLAGPCGPTGQCTNVPGFFRCTCTDSTGNRCQYPTSCAEPGRCGEGQLCMESLQAPGGYVCLDDSGEETLTVDRVEVHVGFLDDLLVNYREALLQQQQAATNQQQSPANELQYIFSKTFCSPRFLRLEAGGTRYGLFWDCADGDSSPPPVIQPLLCEVLVQSGLVESCTASNTSVLTRPTPPPSLPAISVTVEVIQVDSSGEPLSIGQTLGNLERAAQEIRRSGVFPGAQVGSVSAVVPIECSSGCVNGECTDRDQCTCDDDWMGVSCNEVAIVEAAGQQRNGGSSTAVIVGVVVGVVVAILIIILVVIVVVVVISKRKEHKKRSELKQKYARGLADMEPGALALKQLPHRSSTEGLDPAAGSNRSTALVTEENSAYNQLPAHRNSTEGLDPAAGSNRSTALVTEENSAYNQLPAHRNSTDNDYDELPALKNNTSN